MGKYELKPNLLLSENESDKIIDAYYGFCKTKGCQNEKEVTEDFCPICRDGLIEEYIQTNGRDYLPSIYFILGAGTEKVKIGYSTNVKERLSGLQIGSPVKLLVIGSFPGEFEHEARLHKFLEKYRSHGEWFYMADEVIDVIELANSQGWEGIKGLINRR